ncbi:MAG: hypothetical protein LBQ58_09405 [Synergistaceae bacterium]|jgi:hypothetical protein|nr:hypothetical protein [Synergistaceae bacterium]
MSVSAVSSDSSILREEYLEQQRKLQQQKQQTGTTEQATENTSSRASTDASGANQGTSASVLSTKEASANVGAISFTGTNSDAADNQSLISKANSGVELSASELSTLKQVDPALYARVVKAQKAREEVRNQLSENPSNAAQIAKDAISKNTSGDEDTQNLIKRAIVDEYKNFASKYDQVIISGR